MLCFEPLLLSFRVLWKQLSKKTHKKQLSVVVIRRVYHNVTHRYSYYLCRFSNYFVTLNNVIMDILTHKCLFVFLITSLGQIPLGEIPGLKLRHIFRILFPFSRFFSQNEGPVCTPARSLRTFVFIHLYQLWGLSFVFNFKFHPHCFESVSWWLINPLFVSWPGTEPHR